MLDTDTTSMHIPSDFQEQEVLQDQNPILCLVLLKAALGSTAIGRGFRFYSGSKETTLHSHLPG